MPILSFFRELYRYREMLKNLINRELRTRYKASVIGFLWTFINPLIMLVVYTTFFSIIARGAAIQPYSFFLYCALLPWIYFQTGVQTSTVSIVGNANLVKKVYFPNELLPLATVMASLVNYLLGLLILIPADFIFGVHLNFSVVFFVPIVIVQSILILGFSYWLSALNVFFRDVEHITGVIFTAWFYITPVMYQMELIPPEYRGLYMLNPMTPITLAYRDIFLYGRIPDLGSLFKVAVGGCILMISGLMAFRKMRKRFAEEL